MSIDEGSMHWFRLRSRRSSMPQSGRLASTPERRQAFAAAMQQFEEQMTAAKIVTAATRPLNLYYALVQAGLAITAAHADGKWRWRSHGLKPANTGASLGEICVKPDKVDGAFQLVAQATESSQIASPVSIGTIWASLPDICDAAALAESRAPRALSLMDETPLASVVTTSIPYSSNWPSSHLDWQWEPPVPTAFNAEPCACFLVSQARLGGEDRHVWLQAQMAHYPSADGWAGPLAGHMVEEVDEQAPARSPAVAAARRPLTAHRAGSPRFLRQDRPGIPVSQVAVPASLAGAEWDAATGAAHDLVAAAVYLFDAGALLPGEVGGHA